LDGDAVVDARAPSDLFELFNLKLDCDAPAVKAAYRKLQKALHPDIAGMISF
jgi:DnaJ-class molecular chaperone